MVKLGMVVQDLKISIDILRLSNIPRKPIYCSSCWICSHPRHILLVVVQIATLCPHVLHRLKHCPRAGDRWAETSKNRPLSLPTETTSSHNNYLHRTGKNLESMGDQLLQSSTVQHGHTLGTRHLAWQCGTCDWITTDSTMESSRSESKQHTSRRRILGPTYWPFNVQRCIKCIVVEATCALKIVKDSAY